MAIKAVGWTSLSRKSMRRANEKGVRIELGESTYPGLGQEAVYPTCLERNVLGRRGCRRKVCSGGPAEGAPERGEERPGEGSLLCQARAAPWKKVLDGGEETSLPWVAPCSPATWSAAQKEYPVLLFLADADLGKHISSLVTSSLNSCCWEPCSPAWVSSQGGDKSFLTGSA